MTGSSSVAGVPVSRSTILTHPGVLSVVSILSDPVGMLPLDLFRRVGNGKERMTSDPRHRLVHDSPNEMQTAFTFRQSQMNQCLLWGNSYAYIERDDRFQPIGLLPLLPDRTKPMLRNGRLIYETRVADKPVTLQPYEVIHIPAFVSEGVEGRSVLWLIREIIGKALAQERFEQLFYSNNTNLGGTLDIPSGVSETAIEMAKDYILKQNSGLSAAHRWAVLVEGIKANKSEINLQESQYIEGKQFNILDLARVLHIPPNLVGEYGRATWANAEAMDLSFVKYALSTWLRRIESEYSRKLLSEQEQGELFFEFNLEGLLRGDSASRGSFYQVQYNSSSITPNEIRSHENRNPLPGGDELFVNGTMVPLRLAVRKAEAEARKAEAEAEQAERDLNSAPDAPSQAALRAAMRPVLQDAAARIARKEQKALSRAIDKHEGEALVRWGGEFLVEHRQFVTEAIAPALAAMGLSASAASDYAATRVGMLKSRLADPAALKDALAGWEKSAVESIDAELFPLAKVTS